jgi:hypothetical protein
VKLEERKKDKGELTGDTVSVRRGLETLILDPSPPLPLPSITARRTRARGLFSVIACAARVSALLGFGHQLGFASVEREG